MTNFHSTFFNIQPLLAGQKSSDQGSSGQGAVLVITRRQLTEEENLEELDQDFTTLMDSLQMRQLVLDLSAVAFMTSAAIGKVISLHRRLARSQGRLVLCGLQPGVEETLSTSHLLTYFHVADSSQAATEQLV